MLRGKGNILELLDNTEHHVLPHKVVLMLVGGDEKTFQDRFQQIQEEVAAVKGQVEKIKALATEQGYQDILGIINEEI